MTLGIMRSGTAFLDYAFWHCFFGLCVLALLFIS